MSQSVSASIKVAAHRLPHNSMKMSNLTAQVGKPKFNVLSLSLLSACGGKGDDGHSRNNINDNTPSSTHIASNSVFSISAPVSTASLSYFSDGSDKEVVRYFYPHNIAGNNAQEVVIAGFESQPNSATEYSDTRLHVVSVENMTLTPVTNDLLNKSGVNVEAVGDIGFGDFNGDGAVDFFTSAYADMDLMSNAYAFYNSGTDVTQELVDTSQWQHGVAVFDINGDGFDDVYSAGYDGAEVYIGSPDGLKKYSVLGADGGGSHVALGDFLDGGGVQGVVVDNGVNKSTRLFEIIIDANSQTVMLEDQGQLPAPILDTSVFDEILSANSPRSHDVRVEAIDFSNDGLLDILIFSRADYNPVTRQWPELSQLQFLENTGDGNFIDVTENILKNYDFNSNVGYEPVLDDFNDDGYLDIFISDADFDGQHNSSAFLMGAENGSFTETGRDLLSQIIPSDGGMATVVQDARDEYFILAGSQSTDNNGTHEQLSLHPIEFM